MAFTEDLSIFFDSADFAESGHYHPPGGGDPVPVDCIIDRDVRSIGDYGHVSEPHAEIAVQKQQLDRVRRDGVFEFGNERFIVAEPLEDDGAVLTVAAVAE